MMLSFGAWWVVDVNSLRRGFMTHWSYFPLFRTSCDAGMTAFDISFKRYK